MKSATLTIRVDPRLKEALRVAAEIEHRSIANLIEVMIRSYCDQRAIAIASSEATKKKRGVRS